MTDSDLIPDETFDYVIVGAGSAGCVLANRLTANPSIRVLLLEAGGSDKRQEITIPAAFSKLFKSEADWNYQTTPQPGLAGRSIYWPRGKVLGGSSSLNAMMWVIGFAADYDRWAELAGPAWSWSSLQPLFDGTLIPVEEQRDPRPHTRSLLEGFQQAGYALEDANLAEPDGFTLTRVTQHRGARVNANQAYLRPIAGRKNLEVRTGARATRVRFEGTRATGVDYRHGGRMRSVIARAEVILAGGAVNTPQLLLLSGIGDPKELKKHGIPVVAASPEVGRNMRDHLVSLLVKQSDPGTLFSAESPAQIANYLFRRRGMLTSNVAETYGFVRSDPSLATPDLEIIGAPASYVKEGLAGIPGHGISLGPILLQPESRGTVTLRTSDPFEAPIIDPGYFTDPDGRDRERMLAGLEICDRIFATVALRSRTTDHYVAPEGSEKLSPTERWLFALEQLSHTLYHPTSTARMGSDESSVVDSQLRVRGVSGLRVADASVMPEIVRGHTHAPATVIGEKAAQLITDTAPAQLAPRS
jgi:choline dehydrogenase